MALGGDRERLKGWAPVLIAVALLLLLGAASITLLSLSLERSFTASVSWLAHAFADEAELHLLGQEPQAQGLDVLVRKLVQEYVLYAQVVTGGVVLAQDRSPGAVNADLSIVTPSAAMALTRRRLPDGLPYLDIVKTLDDAPQGQTSYIRLGISLDRLGAGVRMGGLVIALIDVVLIGLAIGLIGPLTRRRATMAPAPVPASDARPAVVPSGSGDEGLQRAAAPQGDLLCVGGLVIDDVRKQVHRNGDPLELSPKEYDLLKLLASEPGRVFSDQEILAVVWDEASYASSGDVRKYIHLLRQKLEEDPKNPRLIQTVRGFGYRLMD